MEEKYYEILRHYVNPNDCATVVRQLLSLHNDSGSALLSKAKQMQLEQQHKIDNYAVYYTESEIGILNGVKRIVSLIERHYR
jgi:hypothetical protein